MTQSPTPFFSIFVLLLLTISSCASDAANETVTVNKVCKQSSNYSFCVQAFYSDPRTPGSDDYTLAFVSVAVAYNSATSTRNYITELLDNIDHGNLTYKPPLENCAGRYDKAASLIGNANNDLNSESFFALPGLARKASSSVDRCEAGFRGIGISPSPLASSNKDLKALCEIFALVSKLFTGGS